MLVISFCFGYKKENYLTNSKYFSLFSNKEMPSIIFFDEKKWEISKILNFMFPRVEEDFFHKKIANIIVGSIPKKNSISSFVKKPRYGVMGLANNKNNSFFAATWNGIYKFNLKTNHIERFISHQLINDPHGIEIKDNKIYSVITPLDMVVITDINTGEILEFFSVNLDLTTDKNNPEILNYDWRFITKQNRGALGHWHFNDIRVDDEFLYLTSRLTSCIVSINLSSYEVKIKTFSWDTPVMIHDGILDKDKNIVFTSVDGKILICNKPGSFENKFGYLSNKDFIPLMRRGFVSKSIRIESLLERKVNWCRGLTDDKENYYTTIDGRYEQSRPYFSLAKINKKTLQIRTFDFPYKLLEFPEEIRYMTGFSVLKI